MVSVEAMAIVSEDEAYLLAILQMGIGLDAHDRGETHGALVEGLEEVAICIIDLFWII